MRTEKIIDHFLDNGFSDLQRYITLPQYNSSSYRRSNNLENNTISINQSENIKTNNTKKSTQSSIDSIKKMKQTTNILVGKTKMHDNHNKKSQPLPCDSNNSRTSNSRNNTINENINNRKIRKNIQQTPFLDKSTKNEVKEIYLSKK